MSQKLDTAPELLIDRKTPKLKLKSQSRKTRKHSETMFRSIATRTRTQTKSVGRFLSIRPSRLSIILPRSSSCSGARHLMRHPRPRRKQNHKRWLSTAQSSSLPPETTIESLETQLHQVMGASSSGTTASSKALKSWINTLSNSERQKLSNRLTSTSFQKSPEILPLASAAASEEIPEPSMSQLRLVALNNAIPFLGFGFMDNAILIVAGDAIDTSLGVVLGISTMCAAAIGNIVSDVAGIMLGTVIEDMATQLNLPTPNLNAAQRQLRSVRFANQFGCGLGIVVGCIIGMFPLLLIDSNKVQVRKRQAHLDSIFQDVVTEAGSLVGAAHVSLFVRVERQVAGEKHTTPIPTADGKFLYAKYGNGDDDDDLRFSSDRLLPLGRGIVSRAALTGETWKIDNVQEEPDYHPSEFHHQESDKEVARSMLCVPVLNAEGNTIAVLQAINKIGKGLGDSDNNFKRKKLWEKENDLAFTNQDVQILKALASHIGVALQRLFESEEDEMRVRDTISMLKEYGLAGLGDENASGGFPLTRNNKRRPRLFPED